MTNEPKKTQTIQLSDMVVRETVVSIDDQATESNFLKRRRNKLVEVPEQFLVLPDIRRLMNCKIEDMNLIFISRDPTDEDSEFSPFASFDNRIKTEVFTDPYYPLSDVLSSTMTHRRGQQVDLLLQQMEESDNEEYSPDVSQNGDLNNAETLNDEDELTQDSENLDDSLDEISLQKAALHKPAKPLRSEELTQDDIESAKLEANLQVYRDSHRTVQVQCGGSAIIDEKNPDLAANRIFTIFEEKRHRQMTKHEIREQVCELDRIRNGTVTNHEFCTSLHLISLIFTLLYGAYLIVQTVREPGEAVDGLSDLKVWKVTGFSVYLGSLLYYFIISVLHHGIGIGAGGSWGSYKAFSTLDICGMYSLFGGIATPITFVVINDGVGWTLWGVLMITIIAGIIVQCIGNVHIPKTINISWWLLQLVVVAMQTPSIFEKLGNEAGKLWVIGHVFYFLSMVFYGSRKPRILSWLGPHELQHVSIMVACIVQYHLMMDHVRIHQG